MTRSVFSAICMLLMFLPSGVYANDDVTCEVNHGLYHDDLVIKAFYRFILSKGTGVILINGKVNNDKAAYIISREVRFTYNKKSATDYFLINDIIHKNPLDNVPDFLLMKHYPSFFVENGNSLTFRIKRENKSDFIMSFVNAPFFYCNGSSIKR